MKEFFKEAEYQDNPLRALVDFLKAETACEAAEKYDDMRFVGYVLELGYDEAIIITCDPYKKNVGGVPRGSFLIMAPDNIEGVAPHYTLLRVTATAPTPLSKEVQQTYFELHKKSMPELDIWTRGELQWGALSAKVLGMFYPDPQNSLKVVFSGDVNNIVSAHRYKVYSPNDELLNIIVNSMVRQDSQFTIGKLRLTECTLPFADKPAQDIDVTVSTNDFRGFRTAMFGKTRLGKSNVVKIIAQSIIESTKADKSVGQLIFDINGEYANDNPQDGSKSLRSAYESQCEIYALTKRPTTPSKPLRLNFYEQPDKCMSIIAGLLSQSGKESIYIKSFASVILPSIEDFAGLPFNEKIRAIRKIQYYWAVLKKAGFEADETKLKQLQLSAKTTRDFNPGFNEEIRDAAYTAAKKAKPSAPKNLEELVAELEIINKYRRDNPGLESSSKKPLFDSDDEALLEFFSPSFGAGPKILQPFRIYHDSHASDFVTEILKLLDDGKTVILDLGNATDEIRRYFSDLLSKAVFSHQEMKFTTDKVGNHYVQLYFEEAHNLFPTTGTDFTDVYARFAKEGAKFHIGMVYSTQSPSTINKELLAQTENFFVAHMSSRDEVNVLAKLQVAYDGLQEDILRTRTPGYMRMITFSHRFIIPVQVNKFEMTVPQKKG